jgi:hypothetical protein
MPKISEFFGIAIKMYFNERIDHIPHFHAFHGGKAASFAIETPACIEGKLHTRAERMILEWTREHQEELLYSFRLKF